MPKQKPIIGLTLDYQATPKPRFYSPESYSDRIRDAGGTPILLPPVSKSSIKRLGGMLDGLVLSGGDDIPAEFYRQTQHPKAVVAQRARVESELALIKEFIRLGKPILGTCFGHQLLNIHFGGSMIQHLPEYARGRRVRHVGPRKKGVPHEVVLREGLLRKVLGTDRTVVTSSHHQAVGSVGRNVRVVGRAADGVIEATEFPVENLILSVQWHPEVTETEESVRLFAALVKAAAARANPPRPVPRVDAPVRSALG